MRSKLIATAIIAWMCSSSFGMAQAPQAGAPVTGGAPAAGQNPSVRTTQYDDWALRCSKPDSSAQTPQTCELVQSILVKGQKEPLAQLLIGRTKPDAPMLLMAIVPVNIALPGSARIAVDEKDPAPLELAWMRCIRVGCFASAAFRDDVQKKWRALDGRGRLAFRAGNNQDIAIPMSFKGLKGALDALAKEK